MTSTFRMAAAGLLSALAFAGAQAATVYSNDFTGVGQIASPGSLGTSFSAAGGAGELTMDLLGFASLDGNGNCCTDVFHLSVNGTEIFTGSFNMGGGGVNTISSAGGDDFVEGTLATDVVDCGDGSDIFTTSHTPTVAALNCEL